MPIWPTYHSWGKLKSLLYQIKTRSMDGSRFVFSLTISCFHFILIHLMLIIIWQKKLSNRPGSFAYAEILRVDFADVWFKMNLSPKLMMVQKKLSNFSNTSKYLAWIADQTRIRDVIWKSFCLNVLFFFHQDWIEILLTETCAVRINRISWKVQFPLTHSIFLKVVWNFKSNWRCLRTDALFQTFKLFNQIACWLIWNFSVEKMFLSVIKKMENDNSLLL